MIKLIVLYIFFILFKKMSLHKQDQHKLPQVYLKKFGYLDKSNQWKVSVINRKEKFTRQKSIESFTAVTNIFDINSSDPRIQRIFEELNCDLETEYNNIIGDLINKQKLSIKSNAYLLQLIGNLMIRSDYWREWTLGMLKHKNKENFLQIILGHNCKDEAEFLNIKKLPFYRILADGSPDEIINRVLLYLVDYFMLRLWHYEIVILESQEDKLWFTSNNPVVVHNRILRNEIFAKESELYFPLSPKYLAYVHFKGSEDKKNPLRTFKKNVDHKAKDDQIEFLTKIILDNQAEFLIIPLRLNYRID